LIAWLVDVPCFVREVEPLLKGGIQLLLQNKDIFGTQLNEWRKEGKEEGRKTNKILTERPNEPRTND